MGNQKGMDRMGELLPAHIGLIMDGNGRWAKKRGLPRQAGHKAGASTFKRIVRYANRLGIPYMTVYAFSTENWSRPPEEVRGIIALLREFLSDAANYRDENVRTRFIGDLSQFDQDIQSKVRECEEVSAGHTGLTLNIAINYGGRMELMKAARELAAEAAAGKITPEEIDEELFARHLYTQGQPDVDLVIRPSGEERLSNFLLWQAAYAEFVSMEVLWPDFDEKCLDRAIEEFRNRNRRFGGV
jgi:undecaprenyl diphosphate synthase